MNTFFFGGSRWANEYLIKEFALYKENRILLVELKNKKKVCHFISFFELLALPFKISINPSIPQIFIDSIITCLSHGFNILLDKKKYGSNKIGTWIMLEIQIISQIFLQTADVVSDYW